MSILDNTTSYKGISILRTFVYGRVSTKDQLENKNIVNNQNLTDDSASVKEQPQICKDFIRDYKGFCPKCRKSITLTYEEGKFDGGKSGTNIKRDGVNMFMEMANNGEIDLVLATENDRIGRNQYETQGIRNTLIKLGVQVCAVNQAKPLYCSNCYNPFDDDSGVMMDMFSDMKSHLDLSRIMRNYKIGMPNRIKRGLPCGSKGYGLKKLTDDKATGFRVEKYVWIKEKIKIVKRIVYEYMDMGLGMWKISQRLNEENILSSEGKKWGRSAIKCILNNPIYAGYNRYGWKITIRKNGKKIRLIQPKEKWMLEKAVWFEERLWDLSYYDEILETIKKRDGMGGRASGSNALLIGLLKCGYCGYSMFQGNSKKIRDNGNLYEWKGYMCGTYAHRGACRHNGKSQKVLDGIVIKEVLKLAKNEKTREAYLKRIENQQKSTSKDALIEKEQALRELNKRYSRSTEAYLAGEFSLEQYSKGKKELIPRISQLEIELDQLRQSVSNPQKTNPNFLGVIEKIRKEYEGGNYKELQQLLRKIIEKIEFKRKPFSVKISFNIAKSIC